MDNKRRNEVKSKFNKRLLPIVIMIIGSTCFANNITVNNVSIIGQNTTDHYSLVQFTLSWENSWRNDQGGIGQAEPHNWDAAWVFIKYRLGNGEWKQAWLNNEGNTGPEECTIDIGLLSPGTSFNPTTNPGLGAFIYRNANGTGTNSFSNIRLRWNYGDNGLIDASTVEIKIFAIEMVFIPQGAFYVGSGGSDTSGFYKYPTITDAYQISSEAEINVGMTNGSLYYPLNSFVPGGQGGDQLGPVPAAFPKGYSSFYCMKYEISQQQYVEFLNTLNRTQQNSRTESELSSGITTVTNRYVMSNTQVIASRNGIRCDAIVSANDPIIFYCDFNGNDVGGEENDGQTIACNYLEWADLAAYLDWSGLRPMSEFEYEKSCRGTLSPVPGEYAWGTSSVAGSTTHFNYTFSNSAGSNENIATNYNTSMGTGNAFYEYTGGNLIHGPMRVGIFAGNINNTGRITAGATYYGIMEMSGNVWERAVTVGLSSGRLYTGVHGNGLLNTIGNHDVLSWPGTNGTGAGFRGAGFTYHLWDMNVSGRRLVALSSGTRHYGRGGRGVRTSP